ncbi:unnamed protein product [Urochloa humidicola]
MLKKLGLRPEDHEPQMVTDDEVQLNQEMGQQDPINSQWFTQGAPTSSQQFDEQVPSSSQFSQQGPTGSQLFPHFTSTMLMQMMEQASMSSIPSQHPGPIPDSVFISSNRPMARPPRKARLLQKRGSQLKSLQIVLLIKGRLQRRLLVLRRKLDVVIQ